MSLSDYEIMGGIGYGEDIVSTSFYGDAGDIKSLILNEQPVPTTVKRYIPTPFKAGTELGRPMFSNPYQPINQSPMGRSYRPDQFSYSKPAINNYEYPEWNPDDPFSGIKFEHDNIAGSNSLAIEDYFQTETSKFGESKSINKTMPQDGRQNAYDLITLGKIKEHFADIATTAGNNSNILIILMFIVFIVVAYLQHRQIVRLQKIIGKAMATR
jgi:hypothetical protein